MLSIILDSLVSLTAAILLSVCFLILSLILSRRLLPDTHPYSHMLSSVVLIAGWLAVTVAEAAGIFGLYRLHVMLPFMLLLAIPVWRSAQPRLFLTQLRCHLIYLFRGKASGSRVLKSVSGLVLLTVLIHLLRGMVMPPLAWDTLTYHLVKSAGWVQQGKWTYFHGPEAWNFYNHFPYGGELLWAWAMLPMRSDLLVAPMGIVVWLGCLTGAYASARSLRCTPSNSMLIALVIVSIPSVTNSATIGYVDNTGLMYFLCGIPFLVQWIESQDSRSLFIWIVSLTLAAGVKTNYLPALLSGVGGAMFIIMLRRNRNAGSVYMLLLALLVGIPCLACYIRAFVLHHSPLFPFELRIGSRIVLPGDPFLRAVLSEPPAASIIERPLWYRVAGHVYHVFGWAVLSMKYQHMNLGPGVLLLLGLGATHLWKVTRLPWRQAPAAILLIAASTSIGLFLPSNVALWYSWWNIIGRFWMPLAAACLLLLPLVMQGGINGRWFPYLVFAAVALSTVANIPRGWGHTAPAAVACLLIGLVFLVPLLIRTRRRPRAVRIFTAATASVMFVLSWFLIKDSVRYRIYTEASQPDQPPFQGHRLDLPADPVAHVWEQIDARPGALKIACTPGDQGENWFVYPLMGRRLQHGVCYVSTACNDASAVNSAALATRTCTSYADWIARLSAAGVDAVVVMYPPGEEMAWMHANPQRFKPLALSPGGTHGAFWFH